MSDTGDGQIDVDELDGQRPANQAIVMRYLTDPYQHYVGETVRHMLHDAMAGMRTEGVYGGDRPNRSYPRERLMWEPSISGSAWARGEPRQSPAPTP